MTYIYIYLVLFCEFLLLLFAIYLIFSFLNKTPFYPSSTKQLNELRTSGVLDFNKYKNFIDIGSGDGRIVRWASKNGFATASGIDYNPYLTLYSKLRSLFRKNIHIYNKNFNNHEFKDYDIVYMYIFPEHMDKLKDKLFTEMSKGSVIVTNTFKISNIVPDITYKKFNIYFIK